MADHYARTRRAFQDVAVQRAGFYDAHPGEPLKHSRWQRLVRSHTLHLVSRALAPRQQPASVLSVGCGRGDFERELAQQIPQIKRLVGCDFADEALRLASANAQAGPRLDVAAADALRLPFAHEAFDLALCINVLHHIPATDLPVALAELARVSRRHLVLELKNEDQFYYARIHPRAALGVRVYPTSVRTLANLLGGHGFELERRRDVFGMAWLSPLSVVLFSRR